MRIEKNTKGVVTGADVRTDDQVEVINKDHLIATLTDDVPFVLEMVVENGRGYVPATEHTPAGPGDRHHPGRRGLQPGDPRPLRGRRDPRRPEDQLRQADDRDLDQRLDRAGDGPGRGGQDPPQAPQPVRAVHELGPAGSRRGPRRAAGRRPGASRRS